MTRNEDQRKHDLVESLLQSLYESDKEQARSLVSTGMDRLDDDFSPALAKNVGSQASGHIRTVPRWLTLGLATAAVILIGFLIPMMGNSNNAMAAIKTSLDQALRDIGRHYSVTVVNRISDEEIELRKADLYVKGSNRFALSRTLPDQIAPTWLGSNEYQSWVVPPAGPVLEGEQQGLTRWFDRPDGITTPYLHIATALESMQQNYRLRSLPDDEIVFNGAIVLCRHITGYRKEEAKDVAAAIPSPYQIDLWASRETGVAMKIAVAWNLTGDPFGRESATIVLVDERDLSADFFTAEGHGAADRPRINFPAEEAFGRGFQ